MKSWLFNDRILINGLWNNPHIGSIIPFFHGSFWMGNQVGSKKWITECVHEKVRKTPEFNGNTKKQAKKRRKKKHHQNTQKPFRTISLHLQTRLRTITGSCNGCRIGRFDDVNFDHLTSKGALKRAFSGHPKDVGHKFPIPRDSGKGVVWEWASLEFPLTRYTLFASPCSCSMGPRPTFEGRYKETSKPFWPHSYSCGHVLFWNHGTSRRITFTTTNMPFRHQTSICLESLGKT